MSSAHAFDELGRILEMGGIRSAGHANAAGLVGIAAVNWLLRRFPGLSRAEAGKLTTLGREYRRAGAEMTGSPPHVALPIDRIPLAPTIFGGENLGRRIQYEVLVSTPPGASGGGGYSTVFLDSATVMTPEEIISQIIIDMEASSPRTEYNQMVLDALAGANQPIFLFTGAVRAY